MGSEPLKNAPTASCPTTRQEKIAGDWSLRYGAKHQLHRIKQFPTDIIAPKRVRLYLRNGHFVLQWWDPAARTNLSDRDDGDLVAAITRARLIEERLNVSRDAGLGRRRLGHRELVDAFVANLARRADAGEIGPGTVLRYGTALAHYVAFAEQTAVSRATPYAAGVDRDFQLAFAAFLADRRVAANGRAGAEAKPMRGQTFVQDAARAMFAWAADPDRGHLLPHGFRNPFVNRVRKGRDIADDPLAEPDVTTVMAASFLEACDAYQLALFAPLIFFGLRASEPCYLFVEQAQDDWLRVSCLPELGYVTKGRRDKRFPLVGCLKTLYQTGTGGNRQGLLFVRRGAAEGRERPPLLTASMAELTKEFRRRCAALTKPNSIEKARLRHEILGEAGGIGYDHIQGEFSRLARQLNWPASATLKDFRHLFCTGLENAGVPEHYRRYLMGHATGRAAIVTYTHLNRLREQYESALKREWSGLFAILERRVQELGMIPGIDRSTPGSPSE